MYPSLDEVVFFEVKVLSYLKFKHTLKLPICPLSYQPMHYLLFIVGYLCYCPLGYSQGEIDLKSVRFDGNDIKWNVKVDIPDYHYSANYFTTTENIKVYLKRININGRDTLLHDSYYLTYLDQMITFFVGGLAKYGSTFHYEYRMLGIDTVWRLQSSQVDFMRYFQLQPQTYKFQVRAVNGNGDVSSPTISTDIHIAPAYWQEWWFKVLVVAFFVGVITLIARNQMQKQQLERKNSVLQLQALQSQMNPHFVFNVLTTIQNLWLQKKNEAALAMQASFAKLLRKIFHYSDKHCIEVEQVVDFLENYLELEQIRFENTVLIDFEVEEVLLDDNAQIPPLLLQPIVENSFKHGLLHRATNRYLSIDLLKEGPYLYAVIEDNGTGRISDNMEERESSGLKTIQERLRILQETQLGQAHLHQNLRITDLKHPDGKAAGTRVEVWIPIVG